MVQGHGKTLAHSGGPDTNAYSRYTTTHSSAYDRKPHGSGDAANHSKPNQTAFANNFQALSLALPHQDKDKKPKPLPDLSVHDMLVRQNKNLVTGFKCNFGQTVLTPDLAQVEQLEKDRIRNNKPHRPVVGKWQQRGVLGGQLNQPHDNLISDPRDDEEKFSQSKLNLGYPQEKPLVACRPNPWDLGRRGFSKGLWDDRTDQEFPHPVGVTRRAGKRIYRRRDLLNAPKAPAGDQWGASIRNKVRGAHDASAWVHNPVSPRDHKGNGLVDDPTSLTTYQHEFINRGLLPMVPEPRFKTAYSQSKVHPFKKNSVLGEFTKLPSSVGTTEYATAF